MARAGPAARVGGRGAEAECGGGRGASAEPEAVLGGVGWAAYTAAGFKVVEIESGRLDGIRVLRIKAVAFVIYSVYFLRG